ncbi:MAG: nucleotidyltransferase domain-containing protein, partial [Chloroflexi bacterium]|nr:nucleotidyltransferase domain-containing protein [Chloroflexota bacterium]
MRELIADGAEAIVLAGSHARGEATDLSDIDLYAIGTGPGYALRLLDGRVFSISWRTEAEEREALRHPARVGTVVPGWRNARILHDAAGIAAALQAEARAFDWSTIAAECDAWIASEVTGYTEEVLKLVAARRTDDRQLAAVQRSTLALRLPPVMAVHHRLLYDSENRLWAMVAETIGAGWSAAHRTALGLGEPGAADAAALTLYTLVAEEVDQLLSADQRAVVRVALRAAEDPPDPYAPMKDLAWRDVAEIDARLE